MPKLVKALTESGQTARADLKEVEWSGREEGLRVRQDRGDWDW